jgi:predicted porin
MQKLKLIPAAALATLCGLAAAQSADTSPVKIYGRIDLGAVRAHFSQPNNITEVLSGPYTASRLGFTGSEDLGGGLKASFGLEAGLNINNGTGGGAGGTINFSRGSQVALTDASMGEIALGRMYMPTFWVYLASDPGIGGLGLGSMGAAITQQHTALTGKTGWGGFYDNAVRYRTPLIAGKFRGELAYSANGGSINSDVASTQQPSNSATSMDGRTQGFNAQYEDGPAYLGLAYLNFNTFKAGLGNASQSTMMVAGRYKWGIATVGANLGKTTNSTACYSGGTSTGGSNVGCDMTTFLVSSRFDLNPSSSMDVSFAQLKATSGTLNGARGQTLAVGYTYYLSKRSWLYVQGEKMFNNSKSSWGLNGGLGTGNGTAGFSPQAISVGMLHMF